MELAFASYFDINATVWLQASNGQKVPIGCLLYADDIVIFRETPAQMADALDWCSQFASARNFQFAPAKSQLVCGPSHEADFAGCTLDDK